MIELLKKGSIKDIQMVEFFGLVDLLEKIKSTLF